MWARGPTSSHVARLAVLFGLAVAVTGCTSFRTSAHLDYGERIERAQTFCRGMPGHVHPLEHAEVLGARRIGGFEGRPRMLRTRGARLLVRPRASTSPRRLEQWSRCIAERWALHNLEERPTHDPLAVEGIEVEVRTGPGGHEIWMTADERGAGQEIYRRALEAVD